MNYLKNDIEKLKPMKFSQHHFDGDIDWYRRVEISVDAIKIVLGYIAAELKIVKFEFFPGLNDLKHSTIPLTKVEIEEDEKLVQKIRKSLVKKILSKIISLCRFNRGKLFR